MRPWSRPASRLRGPRSCHDVPMTTTASPGAPPGTRRGPGAPPSPDRYARAGHNLAELLAPETGGRRTRGRI